MSPFSLAASPNLRRVLLPPRGWFPSAAGSWGHRSQSPGSCHDNYQSGDSSELAPRLPCKGKSVRNRGVSQTLPFLVIPRSKLRGGFIGNPFSDQVFLNHVHEGLAFNVFRVAPRAQTLRRKIRRAT